MTDIVVLGASLAGLWAAAAAAGAGERVLLLESDPEPTGDSLRSGVPQGAQPHVLLHRGLRAGEDLLPGLGEQLLAAGAIRVDTGRLPWLGKHGWLPDQSSYGVLSLTRPLFEHVVRQRVMALPGVQVRWGVRAVGLARRHGGWSVKVGSAAPDVAATLVIDATGRSSRLRSWLSEIGIRTPEPLVVDARLGYSTQLIEGGPDPREVPGVVVQATPQSPVGGTGLPVEAGRWLVTAVGFGAERPPRDFDGLLAFLAALPDPALSQLMRSGSAVGEVAIHRQTSNRRQRYAGVRRWPEGLVALGDALCCFDPVYGQGITVSACQALRLRTVLDDGPCAGRAKRLLRDFDRVVDFPWAVAIGQDLQMPTTSGHLTRAQAAVSAWASLVEQQAARGDQRAYRALMGAYHLESPPTALLHPALIASVVLGGLHRSKAPPPRPAVLDALLA